MNNFLIKLHEHLKNFNKIFQKSEDIENDTKIKTWEHFLWRSNYISFMERSNLECNWSGGMHASAITYEKVSVESIFITSFY